MVLGSHSMGQNPNWWQVGNTWSYQAYVTVPISGDPINQNYFKFKDLKKKFLKDM